MCGCGWSLQGGAAAGPGTAVLCPPVITVVSTLHLGTLSTGPCSPPCLVTAGGGCHSGWTVRGSGPGAAASFLCAVQRCLYCHYLPGIGSTVHTSADTRPASDVSSLCIQSAPSRCNRSYFRLLAGGQCGERGPALGSPARHFLCTLFIFILHPDYPEDAG